MTAAFSSLTFTHDKLIAGPSELLVSRQITLIAGENRTRGALLGRTATAGSIAGAAAAGNTGNGTIGSLTIGATVKEGIYRIVLVEPVANAGAFVVEDPDGVVVGRGNVAAAFTGPINFTLADGATDFVAGDTFDVTVSAVTYKHKLSLAAATDGSQWPVAILAVDTDASAADRLTPAYIAGRFNETALVIGAGHTLAALRNSLPTRNIHLITPVGA